MMGTHHPTQDVEMAIQQSNFIEKMKPSVLAHLSTALGESHSNLLDIYDALSPNVRLVFSREVAKWNGGHVDDMNSSNVQLLHEDELLKAMLPVGLARALFHLARVYDDVHFHICHNRMQREKGRSHNANLLAGVILDVSQLVSELRYDIASIDGEIELQERSGSNMMGAAWRPVANMHFDNLPRIKSLAEMLPGELQIDNGNCAGIGGGGGSDVLTLSALAQLFPLSRKMDLVISTRAWLMESQGARGGEDLGQKRHIHGEGGRAFDTHGHPVAGTYKFIEGTHASGRDLEPVLVGHHKDVYMVLDQGDQKSHIDKREHVDLSNQYQAVLSTCESLQTVFVGDTGGDVFGNGGDFSTPDQDLCAQRAVARLAGSYPTLITVVIAPGTDAPPNAPEIAAQAGGKVYHLDAEDIEKLHNLLVHEYRMDGSDPGRYSRTTLLLIEWLRGKRGWQSLNMPLHAVNTDKNPWKSFGYVRDCMGDIIFMPLLGLLPLIDPEAVS